MLRCAPLSDVFMRATVLSVLFALLIPPPLPSAADLWNDYVTRFETAKAQGRGEPSYEFIRWLHAPKTGTSLANTLVRWGCGGAWKRAVFVTPRLERPRDVQWGMRETMSWDWLVANKTGREWVKRNCEGRLVTRRGGWRYGMKMHRGLEEWEVERAVGLFRLPRQRVYSNWVHLMLHYNESRTVREGLNQFLTKKKFWGQQTKVILGKPYKDTRELEEHEVQEAVKRVSRMRMVGLTEEFELSVRLFHAVLGGVPHRIQFENVRPGIWRYNRKNGMKSSFRYDESVFANWTDHADERVYAAALTRFWSDVNRLKSQIELDGLGTIQIPSQHL